MIVWESLINAAHLRKKIELLDYKTTCKTFQCLRNIFLIHTVLILLSSMEINRNGYRAAATSQMESFVIIVNGWKPLTIITKHTILDVVVALDPSLIKCHFREWKPKPKDTFFKIRNSICKEKLHAFERKSDLFHSAL